MSESSPKPHYFKATLASGQPVFFGVQDGYEWIDVHARKRRRADPSGVATGDYFVYGFSVVLKRWSYVHPPTCAGEIRRIMAELLNERFVSLHILLGQPKPR